MFTLAVSPSVYVPTDWAAGSDDDLVDALMLFREPSMPNNEPSEHSAWTTNALLGHNANSLMLRTQHKCKEEDRRAKHREVQRRFMKRKQAEFAALQSRALRMELQYKILLADAEMERLLEEQEELREKLNAQEEMDDCLSKSQRTVTSQKSDRKLAGRLRFVLPREEN